MRVQARITLPASTRASIDAARMRWNPELASGNPAHVTIVYHDEAPDPALLRSRLERACRITAPFRLHLVSLQKFAAPASGAFIAVEDPASGVEVLRRRILEPPFRARERFGLHVTLLHPAHGHRLAEAWGELVSLQTTTSFVAERVELVAGAGSETRTLVSLDLGGASAPG